MQYIASKGMVHRDLAARNILLCENNLAKISDFGLCCTCDDSFIYQASLTKKLPMKWLAIEALTERIFSEKSDIWSFGVLIFETFTLGKVPYAMMNNNEMLDFLLAGNRLECDEAPMDAQEVMAICWEENPVDRPTFDELEARFHTFLEAHAESYGYLRRDRENTVLSFGCNDVESKKKLPRIRKESKRYERNFKANSI